MQLVHSNTLTNWLDEPSAGASPNDSERHSSLFRLSCSNLLESPTDGLSTIRWMTQDGTGDGAVKIYTVFDSGDPSPSNIPLDTKARLVAWYVLSHLNGDYLNDACRSILEVYSTYTNSLKPMLPRPEPMRLKVGSVKAVERPTVRIDSD